MLRNKGYIPKYLCKKKIFLLREKIIKRKYGYLFFRKAISKILPSQATLYYEQNLKKKVVEVWIMFWYEERIEWKLLIKANIHYRLNLLQKIFHNWKLYQITIRYGKLKKEMAIVHSLKNSRRQSICWAFNKWKIYINYKKMNKIKIRIAKEFFWSKYNAEFLRTFFKRWIILKSVSLRNKKNMQNAAKHYENRLISICLEKILKYTIARKVKHEFEKKYNAMYNKKLLSKIFICWKNVVVFIRYKKENKLLAMQHYIFTLKQYCFSKLRKYNSMSKNRKFKINSFRQSHNKRLIARYFNELKTFKEIRTQKKRKIAKADFFFHRNAIQNIFLKFKLYANYRKSKRVSMTNKIIEIRAQLIFKKKKFFYETWKTYCLNQLLIKYKYATATRFAERQVLKNILNAWKIFLLQKNTKKLQIMHSCKFYNLKIAKKHFTIWKSHIDEITLFKNNLKRAFDLYKRHLIEEGLLLIIRSGFLRRDKNFKKCLQTFNRHLFLAYKYFSLWRRKSLKLSFVNKCTTTTSNMIASDDDHGAVECFDWYPICVLAPRTFQNKN